VLVLVLVLPVLVLVLVLPVLVLVHQVCWCRLRLSLLPPPGPPPLLGPPLAAELNTLLPYYATVTSIRPLSL